MDSTITVIDEDHIPTTLNTERSMALLLSPVADVAVCHLLIDGTQIDTTSRWYLAVLAECGVEPWASECLDHCFTSYPSQRYRRRRLERRI